MSDPKTSASSAPLVIPDHVGLILDGNRRWAQSRGLPALEGHRHGSETFKEVALHVFNRGVKNLSAFVFSTENWSRAEKEVGYLMGLVVRSVEKYLDTFDRAGVKIIIVGRREGLPAKVLRAIKRAETKTAGNIKGTLAMCLNYGGQEELVDAVKSLLAQGVAPEAVDANAITKSLYHPELPPVDLLIRTSGEQRTSGFMLWRSAYAELIFNDKYWPDFTAEDFDSALAEYQQRQRRFGK